MAYRPHTIDREILLLPEEPGQGRPRWLLVRHTIDREILLLPEVIVEEYDKTAEENLKPLFIMIWQAAGFDRNYNYDQHGQRFK